VARQTDAPSPYTRMGMCFRRACRDAENALEMESLFRPIGRAVCVFGMVYLQESDKEDMSVTHHSLTSGHYMTLAPLRHARDFLNHVHPSLFATIHPGVAQHRGENIKFDDRVHGQIWLPSELCEVIDTPAFQRLREVRQLGSSFWSHHLAVHTRFEHSIGVAHLALTSVKPVSHQYTRCSFRLRNESLFVDRPQGEHEPQSTT